MPVISVNITNEGTKNPIPERNYNVDIIKALAMISVILLHIFPEYLLFKTLSPYHVWQAMPVFMLLFGYNGANSYKSKRMSSLKQFYHPSFIYKKLSRLIYPFLIIYAIEVAIQFILYNGLTLKTIIANGIYGGWGPGSYFVPVVIQSTLILPLLYQIIKRYPTVVVSILFLINMIMEAVCVYVDMSVNTYRLLVIRYLFALVLGIWLALYRSKVKYRVLLPLAFISLIYITAVNYFGLSFLTERLWLSQHAPAYFWTLLLVIIAITVYRVKADNVISRLLVKIGRASYHIFLIQMLYFWVAAPRVSEVYILWRAILATIICIPIGILFYETDTIFRRKLNRKKAV